MSTSSKSDWISRTVTNGSSSIVAIAYFSRSLRGPELSYPIQQQEMLAVVGACQVFEHYLLAAKFTVRCCVDHKSLTSSFKGLSKVAKHVLLICLLIMSLFFSDLSQPWTFTTLISILYSQFLYFFIQFWGVAQNPPFSLYLHVRARLHERGCVPY